MTIEEARTALREIAESLPGRQQELADLLGVNKGTVSYIINGKRNVGLALAARIEERFGIPHGAWIPAADRSAA